VPGQVQIHALNSTPARMLKHDRDVRAGSTR